MRKFLSAVAIVFTLSGQAYAQDWGKGWKAYAAGDYATALQEWKPLAEQGHAGAQYVLGIMYDDGEGVLQDYKEAVSWFRKAAEQGNYAAQYELGKMYKAGEGVPRDNVQAHMWYNIASANGNELAGESRDEIALKMTAEEIAEAQAMARDCMASDYQNCGY